MIRWKETALVAALVVVMVAPFAANAKKPRATAEDTETPAAKGPLQGDPLPLGDRATAGLTAEQVDINHDGKPEVFNYYDGSHTLRRVERDLNLDGRVDIVSWYANGQLVEEDMDGDFDGRFDWVDQYEGGQRVRAYVDEDYDGRTDLIIQYSNGQVVNKQRFGADESTGEGAH